MNKIEILKGISELVVNFGVSTIVGNTIKTTLPADAKLYKKIGVSIGGFVLSGLVAEVATKYTEAKIDSAMSTVNTVIQTIKLNDGAEVVPGTTYPVDKDENPDTV